MERRRRPIPRPKPGGLAAAQPQGNESNAAPAAARPALLAHIEALVEAGGQIMIGTVVPIRGAAVAHDGKTTVAMLKRRPSESMPALLTRLNAAIATARSTGTRVDEINSPRSDVRYEL